MRRLITEKENIASFLGVGVKRLIQWQQQYDDMPITLNKRFQWRAIAEELAEWLKRTMNREPRWDRCHMVTMTREQRIIEHWARKLNGDTEVKCQSGRIDIMTDTQVVEVKHVNRWKNALGQALAYAVVTNLKPVVVLYGSTTNGLRPIIENVCSHYGVETHYTMGGCKKKHAG
jgi:O-phosphoseryl-tRNA(Cys) synthetase